MMSSTIHVITGGPNVFTQLDDRVPAAPVFVLPAWPPLDELDVATAKFDCSASAMVH